VASPQEVALVREACGKDFLIVTPGIRAAGSRPRRSGPDGDARRRGGRGRGLHRGGRPILEATHPAAAADAIVRELTGR
jgi:orotidine-5'-phosphate decarboxylase